MSTFTQRLRAHFSRNSDGHLHNDRFQRGITTIRHACQSRPATTPGHLPKRLTLAIDVTRLFDEYQTGISYYCVELVKALVRRGDVSPIFISERPIAPEAAAEAKNLPLFALHADRCVAYGPGAASAPHVEDLAGPVDIYLHTSANTENHLAARRSVSVIYDIAPVACPETSSAPIIERCDYYYRQRAATDAAFIAISEFTSSEFAQYYSAATNRLSVIPPGVDPLFTATADAREDQRTTRRHGLPDKYILCVGTLQPRKNLERIISAYASLRERGVPLPQLVLAGARLSAAAPEFARRLACLEAAHHVQWAGYVAREDLPALYRRCAAFIYLSYYEGYGLPVAEALACGSAVICGNRTSLPEVGGSAVRYCDPLSVDAIADTIHAVAGNPSEQARLRAAAPIRAAALPSWESVAARIVDVCRAAM